MTPKPAPKPKRLVEIRLVVEMTTDCDLPEIHRVDLTGPDEVYDCFTFIGTDYARRVVFDGHIVRVTAKRIARKP